MIENPLKISRRQFLRSAGILALAAAVPSSMITAAGKPPAAARTNPIFTGALGRYEGVSIIHSPGDALGDLEIYGSAAYKVDGNKAEWIPFTKMIRQG